ncbi:MAG: hypothetical protein V7K95_25420 [Nostoc sp.]
MPNCHQLWLQLAMAAWYLAIIEEEISSATSISITVTTLGVSCR